MRKIMSLVVIGVLYFSVFSIFATQVHATIENLLSNPGFEDGLTGWIVSPGSARYLADISTKVSGSLSVKGSEPFGGSLGKLSQDVTLEVTPGRQYQISGWIKTRYVTGGGGAVIGLSWVDSIGYTPADGHIGGATIGFVRGTTEWAFHQSVIFSVPPKPVDCVALYFSLDFSDAAGQAWWDDLSLTELAPIADVDVAPDTLNLRSEGQWITSYIELPEGYNVSDVDIYSIMLNDTVPVSLLPNPPVPVPTEIGDHDNDTIPDLMVKFDRAMVQSLVYNQGIRYDEVSLTITGELFDGTPFEGTDMIFVNYAGDANNDGIINILDAAVVSAHWYPGPPIGPLGYDETSDFNKDGAVNILDAGILSVNWGQTVP